MYDIAIIGGGVNGCGIARDAAGRGLSVLLAEKSDLASGTSSASTKLIHGGLRYLEHYAFRLVRESLKEREVLLRHGAAHHPPAALRAAASSGAAPCPADPPRSLSLRPSWRARDPAGVARHRPGAHAGRPAAQARISRAASSIPTAGSTMRGSSCSTPWTRRGAAPTSACAPKSCRRAGNDGHWLIECRNTRTGASETLAARALVNAAGPWVAEVTGRLGANARAALRLVKGSHIVVAKLLRRTTAPTSSRTPIGRIVFAIPYEQDFTLIGTTDVDFSGDPGDVAVSRGGDRLSLRRGERVFHPADRARRRGLVLCGRAPAL